MSKHNVTYMKCDRCGKEGSSGSYQDTGKDKPKIPISKDSNFFAGYTTTLFLARTRSMHMSSHYEGYDRLLCTECTRELYAWFFDVAEPETRESGE